MYSALMAGIANHLRNHWGCYKDNPNPIRVNYGATDSFWNKFNLDRIEGPGLIYASSSIQPLRGWSTHLGAITAETNITNTIGLQLEPLQIQVDITLGMIGLDEEQHFWHIKKYAELAVQNAKLRYPVVIEGTKDTEVWESTMTNFSELSPPPTGKESSTYDVEGQIYPLEATFSVFTSLLFTKEKKLVRAIISNIAIDNLESTTLRSTDVEGNITSIKLSDEITNRRLTWNQLKR